MQPTELNILIDTYRKFIRRGAKRQISNMIIKTHTADTAVLFRHFSPKERIALFNEMSAEYAAEVVRELDEILNLMKEEETNALEELLKYDPSTAGGLMTP